MTSQLMKDWSNVFTLNSSTKKYSCYGKSQKKNFRKWSIVAFFFLLNTKITNSEETTSSPLSNLKKFL